MPLIIPNLEAAPTFDAQAIPDATDLAAQLALSQNTGVVSACGVTPQGSPNMTVQVAAGAVRVAGTLVTVSAVSSLTIAAADSTDRKDIVVVNASGTVSVVKGTDCGTAGWSHTTATPFSNPPPVKPAIPASSVILGEVYVEGTGASGTTSIVAGNIIDKTPIEVTPLLPNPPTVNPTMPYQALNTDSFVFVNANDGGGTVTLPATPTTGQLFSIATNDTNVSLKPSGTQNLLGSTATLSFPIGDSSITLAYDSVSNDWELALASNYFPTGTVVVPPSSFTITQTFSSGTAAQFKASGLFLCPTDAMGYVTVTHAGTLTLAIGPTSTPATTLWSAIAVVAGQTLTYRLPQSWFQKFTLAASATIAAVQFVPC